MLNKTILITMVVFLAACAKTVTIQDYTFKLKKNTEYLPCLKPLEIKDINKIYIKDYTNKPVYLIEMYGSSGACKWQTDELLFSSKNTTQEAKQTAILRDYKPNIYLQSNFKIKFKVTKLANTSNLASTTVTIPFFVVLNNRASNSIISQQNLSINIKLPKQGSVNVSSQAIKINSVFALADYNNIELLSGIQINQQY